MQAAMDDKGISIRQMAKDTGIAFTTLDRKLKGKGKSTFDFVELIAVAEQLDCSVSTLVPAELLAMPRPTQRIVGGAA